MSRHRIRTPNVSLSMSAMMGVPAALGASDPGSTRLVYAMVAGLVIIGIGFIGLGVWLIRQTRYDPPVLAPLERMGDRDWRKRDGMTQRRILDEVRPEGAEPLRAQPDAPELDAEFELSEQPFSPMTDLGPGLAAPAPGSFPVPIAAPAVIPVVIPVETPAVEVVQDEVAHVEEPAAEEPAVQEPAVEEPAVDEAHVEEPAVEEPAVDEAHVEKPAVEEAKADDPPAADDPVEDVPVEGSPESADR